MTSRSGDADRAFARGCALYASVEDAADAWFRAAARAGGLSAVLRVVDHLEKHRPTTGGRLGVWRRRAGLMEFPSVQAPLITVWADIWAMSDERSVVNRPGSSRVLIQLPERSDVPIDSIRAAAAAVSVSATVSRVDEGFVLIPASLDLRHDQRRALVHALVAALVGSGVFVAGIRDVDGPALDVSRRPPAEFPPVVRRALTDAVDRNDAKALFDVGAWCLAMGDRPRGDAWLRRAAAVGGYSVMLRVVDAYALDHPNWNGHRAADWMGRALRLEFPRADAPGIRVADKLFSPTVLDGHAGYGHDTSVRVISPQPDDAASALRAAAQRFGLVTADGRVFADRDALEAAEPLRDDTEAWAAYYTPNWISDVESDGGHPHLAMDWKDVMAPRMARAMTHLLVDELVAAGVTRAMITPQPTD